MALTILATGDIHIGKKSSGIRHTADESASKYTWNKIVDYVIKNKVDVLALTGDIVDQDNRYFEAIGPLQAGFEKLKQSDISVYMIAGNHDFDVLPQLINPDRYDNVHFLGANGTWEVDTFYKNGEQIQFVGWSFPKRYVSEDPLLKFNLPDIDTNITTIGLVHGDVNIPDSKYAPLDFSNFLNTPVHIWILGHIHKPQILRNSPPVVYYPGSPHALSAKEQGVHGPILLTINSKTDIPIEQIPLSPIRYETLSIDITDKNDETEVRNAVTSKLVDDAESKIDELENVSFLVYDIILEGHHSKIRELETWVNRISDYEQEINTTETRILVRKIVFDIQPKVDNMKELAKESSPAGILAKSIIALQNGESTKFTDHLLEEWKSVHNSITQAGTYHPLRTTERFKLEQHQDAKQYILNECKRILTELISQHKQ
ncbi:MAG TPA: DNA repair exonuclease [Bacteroidales bacterium]|nr:DNA repair exonuclease [Bacteroidales bacterium]